MNIEFNNIYELKQRIDCALNIRCKELKSKNIEINSLELFNKLVNIWKNKKNLMLNDIINDIFNYDIKELL